MEQAAEDTLGICSPNRVKPLANLWVFIDIQSRLNIISPMDTQATCHSCKKELDITANEVGRRDECPFCSSDLRVCLNCKFYDPSMYNECREPNAERVLEKDRSNYCDYFSIGSEAADSKPPADDAKKKLDDLFK